MGIVQKMFLKFFKLKDMFLKQMSLSHSASNILHLIITHVMQNQGQYFSWIAGI